MLTPTPDESLALRAFDIFRRRKLLAVRSSPLRSRRRCRSRCTSRISIAATAVVLVERPGARSVRAAGRDRRARKPAARDQAGDPEPHAADRADQALQSVSGAAEARSAGRRARSDAPRHRDRADRARAGERPQDDRVVQAELHRRQRRDGRRRHQRARGVLRRAERQHPLARKRRGRPSSSKTQLDATKKQLDRARARDSRRTRPAIPASCRSRSTSTWRRSSG